jgi:MFS family permease
LTNASEGVAQEGLDAARRRARLVLVAGAALGSTATVLANTVAVIAADHMLHDTVLVGATVSAGIVGAAIGTSLLANVMARRGRRVGLSLGYGLGLLGGAISAAAVVAGSFPLLLLGMLLIGMTNSATENEISVATEQRPGVLELADGTRLVSEGDARPAGGDADPGRPPRASPGEGSPTVNQRTPGRGE